MIDKARIDKTALQKAEYMAEYEGVTIDTILDVADFMACERGITIEELLEMVDEGFYSKQLS